MWKQFRDEEAAGREGMNMPDLESPIEELSAVPVEATRGGSPRDRATGLAAYGGAGAAPPSAPGSSAGPGGPGAGGGAGSPIGAGAPGRWLK